MTLSAAEKVAFNIIDQWLQFQTKYAEDVGIQVSVRKKGELIFNEAYGYANIEKKTKYKTSHIGHVASNSKMFTTCAALQLQSEGLLNIHDPIIKYLPELAKHKDKRFKEITIRDLMNNRSGIFRDGLDCAFWELEKPFLNREELIEEVKKSILVYDPNTVTKYSNMGVSLLGIVLENASNLTYDEIIKNYILKKIPSAKIESDYGLTKGFVYADGHSKRLYNDKRKVFVHSETNGMVAATGFCSNTESMSLFLYELYFGEKLLSLKDRREIVSLNWPVLNIKDVFYGLGTQFTKLDDKFMIGHSGGYPGFMSQTRYYQDSDYIISVIMNSQDAMSLNILQSILSILNKISSSFSKTEIEKVVISQPVFSKWGSSIYIVSDKKAIGFALESGMLHESLITLEKKKDGFYYAEKIVSMSAINEPVKFFKDGKTISKVKFGAMTYYNEKEFMLRSKTGFQK